MVSFSFENSTLNQLLANRELLEQLQVIDPATPSFLNDWNNEDEDLLVQTSGSTGAPKQIKLTKESMRISASLTLKYFDLKKGDTVLQCLPTQFIAGKMIWVRSIVGQLKVIATKPTSNPLAQLTQKIDFAAMTPPQMETALNETPEKFDFIKTVIIGGAPVSIPLQERLQSLSCKCFATYGMTETITHIAVKQLNQLEKSSYYQALPSIVFSQGDEENLLIKAPHISNEFLATEDIVKLIDSTHFEWLGRKDFVINSGGVKLFPEVIEQKISDVISTRYFISKQADETFGEVPILILEGRKEFNLELLRPLITKLEMPKKIIYQDKFSETKNGKIDRLKSK